MKNPKSILITGASSGIGEALAYEYAAPGVTLHLSGRNIERLKAVKSNCEANGAKVHTQIVDVTDELAMSDWIIACDQLDLVIANAGISSGIRAADNIADHTKSIFEINVGGVFNTVHPAIESMKPHGHGQIAIVSSVAGFRGLPSSPAYSTSKVTIKAYGEALRGFYHADGLEINVICPGFVRSRLTDKNNFKMPFFMEADRAAKIIRRDLENNKAIIMFPWQMRVLTFAARRLIPEFILERILRRLPKK